MISVSASRRTSTWMLCRAKPKMSADVPMLERFSVALNVSRRTCADASLRARSSRTLTPDPSPKRRGAVVDLRTVSSSICKPRRRTSSCGAFSTTSAAVRGSFACACNSAVQAARGPRRRHPATASSSRSGRVIAQCGHRPADLDALRLLLAARCSNHARDRARQPGRASAQARVQRSAGRRLQQRLEIGVA